MCIFYRFSKSSPVVELPEPPPWDDEPVGDVDDGVELRVVADVVLDAAAQIAEEAVDALRKACFP